MKKSKLNNIFSDIRFWILFFFTIRLFGITNAPLEISHNWRQSLTNMISRNLFEGNTTFLYPQVDMSGDLTGIIGAEFPLYNFATNLLNDSFGYQHWYGRLVSLILASIGLLYFYKLLVRLLNNKIAFNATLILTVSLWFIFSRKIMPDVFSLSLVIIGLYHLQEYLTKNLKSNLFYYFTFVTLGVLCKIPALSLLSVVGVLIFIPNISTRKKVIVYAVTSISVSIIFLWYFYWVPNLIEVYHCRLYFPKGLLEGINEIKNHLPQLFERFYFSAFHSFIAFGFFIVGMFVFLRSKNRYLKIGIGIISFVFSVFVLKTGAVFPLHSYYILPFVPIMAIIAAFGVSKLPQKYQILVVVLITIESIGNQQNDFFIKESQKYRLRLETITDEYIPKNDLIIINGGQSPQGIYFSNRKGWTIFHDDALNSRHLDSLQNLGAKFLIIDNANFQHTYKEYPQLFQDDNFAIYKLNKRQLPLESLEH